MTDQSAERVQRLTHFANLAGRQDTSHPYRRPKDAATLILVDRSSGTPKVLLGKRHAGHAFMPSKFVFPGGGVEPWDKHMSVAAPLHPNTEARLMNRLRRGSPARARAFALAAIRETYEETGLLLGRRAEAARIPEGPWAIFARNQVLPDLSAIHFVGRAITPPGRPRRFDARFFTMDASEIAHRVEGIVGPEAELIELVWMPLTEAKHLDLPAVTAVMLEELDARLAHGLDRDMPVPLYRMVGRRFVRELL